MVNKKVLDNFLSELTKSERAYLLEKLRVVIFSDLTKEVTECPCCKVSNFIKHSKYKGFQKYKCKNTSKVFSSKSKSVISGISNLNKFDEMLTLIIGNKYPTLIELHKKLNISQQTAFDWRSKIITAMYKVMKFDSQVIEFDETNFRISRKGRQGLDYKRKRGKKLVGDNKYNVKVFMAYSRTTKKLELFQSHMGRTDSQDVENYLGDKKDLVVYSDRHQAYRKFYKKRNILNGIFKSSDHISKTDKTVHNQTLNYYSGALGKFLNEDLRGVSTKYLQGYLNWFMFIVDAKEDIDSMKQDILDNKFALDIYKQKEKEFQYFLRCNGRSNYGHCKEKYIHLKAA